MKFYLGTHFLLPMLGLPTCDDASSSWPTATETDASASRRHGYMLTGHSGTTLHDAIDSHLGVETSKAGEPTSTPAVLNPRFVEALMGFPPGWCTLPSPQLPMVSRTGPSPATTRPSPSNSQRSATP